MMYLRNLFLFAIVWGCGLCSSYAADSRPNVLFLICDDLNCDLSSYGHAQVQTPNLDALAARGVRFPNAHCQYPLCGPSRASFMTGLYCDQTLVRRNGIYIREHLPNVNTLSQMYRDAGYFATRIGKMYHYNVPKHIGTSGHDDPYSWNYTINPRGRDKKDEGQIFSVTPGNFGGSISWLAADGTDEEQTDGIAATEATKMLQRHADEGSNFFLAVGLYRPHTPYVAPKKYFDMYPIDSIQVPTVPDGYLDTLPSPAKASITRKKAQVNLKTDLAKQCIQAYYASITFADAQLGRILNALEQTGQADNTIVLFTSDHGYHMGEHGHYQKSTLFNNATNVPLIMAGPGIANGKVARTMAEMVDFYPTLADLTGLEKPAFLSGKSMVPALKDPNAIVRDSAFTQYDSGYSIRTADFRYTEWGENAAAGRELYDQRKDPSEMNNLADDPAQTQTIQRLSQQLRQRIKSANRPPQGLKQNRIDIKRKVPQRNS
ncbi:sulfatase [Planctomycetes bacterium K23_9]|uniref:Choline-sulfatase n=1 Tax=Stieleria marina TaxID=1930275 RepID=A0A517P1D3_9BACT|nr:Choline-sulfatase [Planctomycetes bacterium K23_9]